MQPNKVARTLKIQMITTFTSSIRCALSSFQISVPAIWDYSSFIISREVDRRQLIATEATRPSGASTVRTDRTQEKCGSFLRPNSFANLVSELRYAERYGPVAQLVRAHA